PARTTIICGVYPTCLGAQHMRSMVLLPTEFRMFPQYLREAGYYCTNNSKEDYNVEKPGRVWDESSPRSHWKNRAEGQPFFAVFNITTSHESKIRKRPHKPVHNPANVKLPAYHPDASKVRRDWAQYYDKVTEMDAIVGKRLHELERAGLADDTIVLYFGDHGSGMPRSKRWLYQSGLRVPLVVFIPSKFRTLAPPEYAVGGSSDRLVGFIDLAPTILSLAGIESPSYYQGHAMMGAHPGPPQEYLFGFRDRMDERIDMSRAVRDKHYEYIRNYYPEKPQGQFLSTMFEMPTTRVWKRLNDRGRLTPEQSVFWEPKPAEELYDLDADPQQVRNLAANPELHDVRQRFRDTLRVQTLRIRDLGFMPEAEMLTRSGGRAPYDLGHDPTKYPLERIYKTAELAASEDRDPSTVETLAGQLQDKESCVRFWAVQGLLLRGADVCVQHVEILNEALKDPSPSVRIVAATALSKYAPEPDAQRALDVLIQLADVNNNSVHVAIEALNAIDNLDQQAAGALERIQLLPQPARSPENRYDTYVERLLKSTLSDLRVSQ
ncbi:MAG: sulfatase-like hydrolase/transferase, partial [Pirellulales bacterium]